MVIGRALEAESLGAPESAMGHVVEKLFWKLRSAFKQISSLVLQFSEVGGRNRFENITGYFSFIVKANSVDESNTQTGNFIKEYLW